jgi:uncharacterized membrane-anchored protein YitT (DUF2179 family)
MKTSERAVDMPKKSARSLALDYLVLTGLAALTALNYQIFILHNAFAPAGVNGLATMVQYLFHFSIGYMSLIINIPLAAFALFRVGREFALKTLTFVVAFSGSMLLLQSVIDVSRFVYYTGDGRSTLLAPVASGTINGLIYGAAIRRGGSTGGTDFIAAYVHKKRPEYSMVRIIFALNATVAGISYFVYDFNIEAVILSILYSFITSKVSDSIIKGGEQALKVEIVTTHPEDISKALIERLKHSVTIVSAEGGYTHQKKALLICVVNKHQITRMTEILSEFPDTFACVSDVTKTLGNFKHISR